MADMRPFRIEIPEADLDDLRARLDRACWADDLPGAHWEYGVPAAHVRELAGYWRDGFDWRRQEARLNAYPQFTTTVDGQKVHFLHVRSPESDALPLILTHGWPGSVAEFLDVIGPLTDPRAHGADPADIAFHLVIPSLPGFGFSGPTERGWTPRRIGAAWAEVMARLGYRRYGAAGNDWGSYVAPEVGGAAPAHVIGVHVTQLFSLPAGQPGELEDLSAASQRVDLRSHSGEPERVGTCLPAQVRAAWAGWKMRRSLDNKPASARSPRESGSPRIVTVTPASQNCRRLASDARLVSCDLARSMSTPVCGGRTSRASGIWLMANELIWPSTRRRPSSANRRYRGSGLSAEESGCSVARWRSRFTSTFSLSNAHRAVAGFSDMNRSAIISHRNHAASRASSVTSGVLSAATRIPR